MKQGNMINLHGVMDQEVVQLEYQLLQKNKDKGIYMFFIKKLDILKIEDQQQILIHI